MENPSHRALVYAQEYKLDYMLSLYSEAVIHTYLLYCYSTAPFSFSIKEKKKSHERGIYTTVDKI